MEVDLRKQQAYNTAAMVISFLGRALDGKRIPGFDEVFGSTAKPTPPEDADPEALLAIVEGLNAALGGLDTRNREVI